MSEQNLNEVWQVEVGGQIYEAPFGELSDWIGEGSLLPQDKVRKGNLRWIEACKVPYLIPFFNAKEKGLPLPVVVKTTSADTAAPIFQSAPENFVSPANVPTAVPYPIEHSMAADIAPASTSVPLVPADPNNCFVHSDAPTAFVCDGCGNSFCKACPKSYGGTVKICSFCGAMCRPLGEVQKVRNESVRQSAAVSEGFGATDYFNALSHPFKFKGSLFFGALMFMLFTLGQSAAAIGGIFMVVSALICLMMANMLTFGVLANTVDNFSQGRLEANFMPDFDDFSLWNDVVHPFFLSIGAYLVSFGPFFVVLIVGFYMVTSSVGSQMDSYQRDLEKLPGTHYYAGRKTVEQSQDVRKVIGDINVQNEQRLAQQEQIAAGNTNVYVDEETRQQEELWASVQESRTAQLESVVGPSPEKREVERQATIRAFFELAAPVVVIGAIFFLWGAFFFPVACAVAGYTRSFAATVNPMVGLDTIRHLGSTYPKILVMGLAMVIVSGIVSGILGAVFSPLDLPGMGNIPATALGAFVTFYFSVVFSCIIGYALFKSADKLALPR